MVNVAEPILWSVQSESTTRVVPACCDLQRGATVALACWAGRTHDDRNDDYSAFLTADHRRADALFAAVAQRGDWAGCRKEFEAFRVALEQHISIEVQVLLPAFEKATDITAGPTRIMRHEYGEMLAMLEMISSTIDERDFARCQATTQPFSALMASHGTKEENVLYPMCDEALPGLTDEALSGMTQEP